MNKNQTYNMTIIYTIFVVLLPLISVYASGVPGFTLGDMILVLFLMLYFMDMLYGNRKIIVSKSSKDILPLIVVIPLVSIVSIMIQGFMGLNVDIVSITIRIIRREFYYLSVLLLSSKWFDFDYGKRAIILVGKLGSVFLAIQYTAYYIFHVVIRGFVTFLPVYHENYQTINYSELYKNMFRPTSFLLEPAHFSRYMLIPLVLCLFNARDFKRGYFWSIIFSLSIVATTSGIGVICTLIVWICWLIKVVTETVKNEKLNRKKAALILLLPVVLAIALSSPTVQSTLLRIQNSRLGDINTAGGARFRGYIQYFQLPGVFRILGMGYGADPATELSVWFSGASYILYGCGIIGFCICVVLFVKIFLREKNADLKVLCLVFFALFGMDDCFMSHIAVVYLSYLLKRSKIRSAK